MGLHLHGWWENQDGAGAETELAAITDTSGLFTVQSTDFLRIPSAFNKIAGAWAGITTTVTPRARFQSPSLDERYGRDQTFIPYINGGTTDVELASPQAFNDWRQTPLEVKVGEDVRVLTLNNPAVASDQWILAIFSDGVVQPVDPAGGFWARATAAASALAAGTYGLRNFTFATALKVGWYEILHGKIIGDTLIGARGVFDKMGSRPPFFVCDAASDLFHKAYETPGQFGSLGKFYSQNGVNVELLANDADNQAQEGWFYIRPTAGP